MLINSNRWPLLIDPQLQANIWIKEMAGKQNIKIINQNMPQIDIMIALENALYMGTFLSQARKCCWRTSTSTSTASSTT